MNQRASALVLVLALAVFAWVPVASAQKVLQVYLTPKEEPYLRYMREVVIPEYEHLNPGVTVDLQVGVWQPDPIIARYIAGTAPDVIQISSLIGTYLNMLAPLNRYTQEWPDLADFPPGMIDNVSVDGLLYAIPWSLEIRTFTYRKDRFAEAGLDPEAPPTTWDELLSLGRTLTRTDAEGSIVQAGFKTGSHEIDVSPFLLQAGNRLMSDDLTRATFAAPDAIEAVDFVRSLYYETPITARGVPGLKQGGSAMEYVGFEPGDTAFYRDEDIGIALPLRHRDHTILGVHFSWSVANTSALMDEAWKWIELVSRRDHVIGLAETMGGALFPPRMSLVNEAPWNIDPRWRTVFDSMAISTGVPFKSPHFEVIRSQYLRPALRRIIDQGEPAIILESAEWQANVWLAEQLQAGR